MKKEIKKQIRTLRKLAKFKLEAADFIGSICASNKLRREAADLKKQVDELKKANKG